MTNKTTLQRLKLDPYFSKTIETNLNVWSHDQNSYEIKFEFYDHQCDKPIDLTGADMRILLDHHKSVPQIFTLEIESKVLGLAKFVIPDQIRGLRGKIKAHIYADYHDRTHDFGSFSFYMNLSEIDKPIGNCIDKIYVSEFEEAVEKVKELNENFSGEAERLDKEIQEINDKIDASDVVTNDRFEENMSSVNDELKQLDNKINTNAVECEEAQEQTLVKASANGINKRGVTYVAHRGANTDAPENTLIAFDLVSRHNAIETDVQVTKDGVWVCLHDITVDRMTDGTGKVADLTYDEIKELTIDKFDNPHHNNNLDMFTKEELKIPTFEEYIYTCYKKNKKALCEIKNGNYTEEHYKELLNIIKKYNMNSNVSVLSFDLNKLKAIKTLDSMIEVNYLSNTLDDEVIEKAKGLGVNSGVGVKWNGQGVNLTNLVRARNEGLMTNVWTVPLREHERFEKIGVDYITTDSKSGNLKYLKLTDSMFQNGFKNNDANVDSSYVCQVSENEIQLSLNLIGGVSEYGTTIIELPRWATPSYNIWRDASVRLEGYSVGYATCDILGRKDPQRRLGQVIVGRNWTNRTTWARIDTRYTTV